MSNIKKLRKLKIQWKILLSAMLVIFVFGGYMVFAKADSSVTVSVTTTATIVNQGTESNSIVATMSGRDENNVSQDSPDNYKPAVRNLKWTVSNSDIIKFVVSDSAGTKYADTAEGTANPTIYGNRAGKATVTATYYTKAYGPDGSITYEEELGNDSVDIIVPLKINSFKAYRNGVELTKEEMLCYQVGDIIEIATNANDTNKIFVETDNDKTGSLSKDGIVEKVSSSGAKVTLKIVGGGRTNLKVRTADGDGINSLTATYQITSKVEYTDGVANSEGHSIQKLSDGTRFITLSDKDFEDFKEETIPSNIKYPATAGVTYVSSDTDVITYKAGSIKGVNAGVAQATAGVASIDVQGNIGWATKDVVNVVVPFKKLGNDVSNMNVGDSIQLKTSAKSTEVTWSTSDNSVLQVDATTGLVTAMGAGKATIYATRVDDELSTKYKLNNQLSYEITVIDGFGLSLTSMSVNIGDTQNLVALVTNNPSKDDITFTVENQPDAAGVVPTETLINVVQSEDGSKVDYFDRNAYLAQSPQFYKQMAMAAGFERIFETGPVFRAEKSYTNKHATEFSGFDLEFSYITSYKDVMAMEEQLLKAGLQAVKDAYGDQIQELFGKEVIVPETPFPVVKLADLYKGLEEDFGYVVDDSEKGDLTTEAERLSYDWVKKHYNHEFLFVTDYDAEKRAFYHMRDENGVPQGYDLIWRGVEITTGAQREHRYEVLKKQAEEKGLAEDVKFYLEFFQYGCPPHGGFGLGIDRLTMLLVGESIKDAEFLFRGPNRLTP